MGYELEGALPRLAGRPTCTQPFTRFLGVTFILLYYLTLLHSHLGALGAPDCPPRGHGAPEAPGELGSPKDLAVTCLLLGNSVLYAAAASLFTGAKRARA